MGIVFVFVLRAESAHNSGFGWRSSYLQPNPK